MKSSQVTQTQYPASFTVKVASIEGLCPTGEAYATKQIDDRKTPVLSCEGGCIRGEIARLAANIVAEEMPLYARACHAEAFFVPDSSMARWVKHSDKVLMIDGCFLKCHGRLLQNLIGESSLIHIDVLPLYNKFEDIFLMSDVPEEERKATARQVADKIMSILKENNLARDRGVEPAETVSAQ